MNFPDTLRYTKDHEWVRVEGNTAVIGITDFAQGELGDVIYIDIQQGASVNPGDSCGTVEAVKTVSDIYSPVGGTITEVNTGLNDAPDTVNHDPYGAGWLLKIAMSDPADLDAHTMDAAAYKALIGK